MSDEDHGYEEYARKQAMKVAREAANAALVRLEPYFAIDAKLTLVVRVPSDPDGYVIMTKDDECEVIRVLERAIADTTPRESGGGGGE